MRQNPYSPFVKIGGVAKIIDAAGYIKCTFHCSFQNKHAHVLVDWCVCMLYVNRYRCMYIILFVHSFLASTNICTLVHWFLQFDRGKDRYKFILPQVTAEHLK